MRFYLSSYRLGNHVERLRKILPPKSRVAVVANALDVYSNEVRRTHMAEVYDPYAELERLGFRVSDLDLRTYFGKPDELVNRLRRVDFVWALGGESFVLRRAMALSGFDIEIVRRLHADELAYGGFSAGAVVMAPSLRGIHLMDDINKVPDGYTPEVIWDGVQLIDFAIVPHYRSDHPEAAAAEAAKAYFEENEIDHEVLADGDVIVCSGADIQVLRKT